MQLRLQAAAMVNLLARQHHLDLDYSATRKDFDALELQLEALRKENFARSMAIRAAMTRLTTNDKWKKITAKNLGLFGF